MAKPRARPKRPGCRMLRQRMIKAAAVPQAPPLVAPPQRCPGGSQWRRRSGAPGQRQAPGVPAARRAASSLHRRRPHRSRPRHRPHRTAGLGQGPHGATRSTCRWRVPAAAARAASRGGTAGRAAAAAPGHRRLAARGTAECGHAVGRGTPSGGRAGSGTNGMPAVAAVAALPSGVGRGGRHVTAGRATRGKSVMTV